MIVCLEVNDVKNKSYAFIEKWMPFIMLIVVTTLYAYIDKKCSFVITSETYDKILDSMITFVSVVLGFVGVLIGILFSIRNTKLVKMLFEHKSREKLQWYFTESFLSGVIFILLSIAMYAKNEIMVMNKLVSLWVGFIAYTLLCNCRIIKIIMYIVFYDDNKENPKQDKMEIEKRNKLREKYRK